MNISIGKKFNLDFRDKFRKIGIQKDKINEEKEERRRGRGGGEEEEEGKRYILTEVKEKI